MTGQLESSEGRLIRLEEKFHALYERLERLEKYFFLGEVEETSSVPQFEPEIIPLSETIPVPPDEDVEKGFNLLFSKI